MDDKKQFILRITPELHKQLKVLAATKGTTMQEYIKEAIQDKIEREATK